MGLATTRTLRALQPARAGPAAAEPAGLCFSEPDGPLVVVCGLVGGAGASTLAYRLAAQAAAESPAPVLLCEPEGPAAGLAVLAGRASPLGLGQLARETATGHTVPRPFAQLDGGPRLIARPPAMSDGIDPPLGPLLHDARAAHGLVVADCGGVAHPQADQLIDAASHLLLCLPATNAALERTKVLLATRRELAQPAVRTALVAVATTPKPTASVRSLRRLARSRYQRLALIPHLPSGGRDPAPHALDPIASFLRRP